MIRVVAWLWKDESYRWNDKFRYGAKHVNQLAKAVRKNLDLEHEFVCITDDPEGIDPDIRIVPLWDDLRWMGGCYTRLRAFAPDMADIIGPRFVWMDVDCVVTGDLTPLFDRDEDFVIWANRLSNMPYCGSMVMMNAGARKEVWEDFDPAVSPLVAREKDFIGTDQAWIASRLHGEATWTPEDGVMSRHHVGARKRMLKARYTRQGLTGKLPEHSRVVFFHGPFDPSQPELQQDYPWVRDYWNA